MRAGYDRREASVTVRAVLDDGTTISFYPYADPDLATGYSGSVELAQQHKSIMSRTDVLVSDERNGHRLCEELRAPRGNHRRRRVAYRCVLCHCCERGQTNSDENLLRTISRDTLTFVRIVLARIRR